MLNKAKLKGICHLLKGDVYRTENFEFRYPKHLVTLSYRERFTNDTYEDTERGFLENYLRPEDRVLELGACIGVVACATNRLLSLEKPEDHVVVEANPDVISALELNRRNNSCQFVIEYGAVSENSTEEFFPYLLTGGRVGGGNGDPQIVPGIAFTQLLEKYPNRSALIMDIEGAEYSLIESHLEHLKTFRLLMAEFHLPGREKCYERAKESLRKIGFAEAECVSDGINHTSVWINSEYQEK